MKKLTKSQNNRVLTGTLAGIADYFGIDPTTARVIFVFLSFFLEGAPILLYLLLVLLVPKAESESRAYQQPYESSTGNQAKQAEAVADDDTWSDF